MEKEVKKLKEQIERRDENLKEYDRENIELSDEIDSIREELGMKNFNIIYHAANKDKTMVVPRDEFVKGVCVDHAICLVKQKLYHPDSFELKSIKRVE